MCLAVPGKIVEIDASNPEMRMARVDFAGVIKDICIEWLPGVAVGDYVLAHVGTALNKINEQDALETMQLLREMGNIGGQQPIGP
jgi:hydrogenase expression/formation protein HypC